MTRQQLLDNIDSMELTQWRALYKVEGMEHEMNSSGGQSGEKIPIKHGRPEML